MVDEIKDIFPDAVLHKEDGVICFEADGIEFRFDEKNELFQAKCKRERFKEVNLLDVKRDGFVLYLKLFKQEFIQ